MALATDDFIGRGPKDDPYTAAVAITKSDTVNLGHVTRAIYIGVAGDVAAILVDNAGDGTTGTPIVFKAMPVGIHRLRLTRVNSTNTAATDMVALW